MLLPPLTRSVSSPQAYKVENLLASFDAGCALNLEALAAARPDLASYVPDAFPGLICVLRAPSLRAIVFAGGTVVLTGAQARGLPAAAARVCCCCAEIIECVCCAPLQAPADVDRAARQLAPLLRAHAERGEREPARRRG